MIPPYLDTSALIKRYDPQEPGAEAVMARLEEAKVILTSALTPVEAVSAFRMKQRSGVFSAEEVCLAIEVLEAHTALQYRLVSPKPPVYREAKRLLLRYKLRAYDALQLATALVVVRVSGLEVGALEFWTSDRDQAEAAQAEGLSVRLV